MTRESMEDYWDEPPEEAIQEMESMVLISETKNVLAENQGTGHNEKISLLTIAGDMNLAIPDTRMLGSLVSDRDMAGCVVSREAAEQLFSSQDVVGEEVVIQGDTLLIRGVADIPLALCLVQGEKGALYDSIKIKAFGLPVSAVKRLLGPLLPSSYDRIFEGRLYAGIARLFLSLPGWVILFGIFLRGRNRFSDVESILLHVGFFACVCLLLSISVRFSEDYVPNAWSDFAFWRQLTVEKWEQCNALVTGNLSIADGKTLWQTGLCIASSIGGAIGLAIWRFQTRALICIVTVHSVTSNALRDAQQ